jgi:hypothetical protein
MVNLSSNKLGGWFPATACLPSYHKTILKRMQSTSFEKYIEHQTLYWSNSGKWELFLHEYWRKSMKIDEKIRETCSSRERKVKILLVFPKYLRIFLTPSLSQLREKSSCSVFTKCGVPCNLDKLLSLFEAWINIVKPCIGQIQENESSFYMNIEEKVWKLMKKYRQRGGLNPNTTWMTTLM